jgi:hypothetical protein
LAWQWQVQGKVAREHDTLSAQLTAARLNADELDQQLADVRADLRSVQDDTANLQARLVQVNAQRTGRSPRRVYQWDDNSPVLRVPKQMVAMLPFSSVADRRGHLSEQAIEALQLSSTEAADVQSAIDLFLSKYAAAQGQNMRVVEPTNAELNGHTPEETRVFEMSAIGSQMKSLREELFQSIAATLGPERFKVFQNGMYGWMPMDEEFHGLNSGMSVFNLDRRERYYRPKPGDTSISWSFSSPAGQSTMYMYLDLDEISDLHRGQLQDWIALAKSKPPERVTGEP